MSSKKKQSNRTKGNVRPSSSARAAEHLIGSSGSVPSFVGFGAMADLGYVPSNQSTEDMDSEVDGDLRMALRKCAKRDATTKLKALQEFAAYCKEKDSTAVKSVLPYWPRIYAKMSIDHDRRVREASQQALEVLALQVRRHLAPHLKSLMGPWTVARCDLYAPAASAANAAFQSAFPPAKQTEAIVYCKADIIEHLQDNLLNLNATTLCDPKSTEPEEMEAKFLRVLSASLSALALLMSTLPEEHQVSLKQDYQNILKNGKFWKYAKHSSNTIRAAFYSVLSALCIKNKDIALAYADKICPAVLHFLDESDPIICIVLWEAALYCITTIEDCWSKVNARKGVLPKLWALLKQGGSGNASIIYPNLMPFLSKIPPDIIGDSGFWKEFFGNMRIGMALTSVQSSPREMSAVVMSFVECIRYAVSLQGNEDLLEYLIEDELWKVVEASFIDDSDALSNSPLYALTTEYITLLHKNYKTEPKSQREIISKSIFDVLLSSILQCGENFIRDPSQEIALNRLSKFLVAFTSPPLIEEPKKKMVQFHAGDASEEEEKTIVTKMARSKLINTHPVLDEESTILEAICHLCKTSLESINDDPTLPRVSFFCTVTENYLCARLMSSLTTEKTWKPDLVPDCLDEKFMEQICLPWLNDESSEKKNIKKCYIGVICALFLLDSSDKDKLLDLFFKEINNPHSIALFLTNLVKFTNNHEVELWFQKERFGQCVIQVTKLLCGMYLDECRNQDTHDMRESCWTVVKMALSPSSCSDTRISHKHIEQMLQIIHEALPSTKKQHQMAEEEIQCCLKFVCDVANTLFCNVQSCWSMAAAEGLVLDLFALDCKDMNLLKGINDKLVGTWTSGLESLIKQRGWDKTFLNRLAHIIKDCVALNISTIQRLSSLLIKVNKVCDVVSKHEIPVMQFLSLLDMKLEREFIQCKWQVGPMIQGQVSWSNKQDIIPNAKSSSTLEAVPECIRPCLFMAEVLKQKLQLSSGEGLPSSELGQGVLDLALCRAYCEAFIDPYHQNNENAELVNVIDFLHTRLHDIFEVFPKGERESLLSLVVNECQDGNVLLALALDMILSLAKESSWDVKTNDFIKVTDSLDELTDDNFACLQIALNHLCQPDLVSVVEVLAAHCICIEPSMCLELKGGRGYLCLFNRALEAIKDPLHSKSELANTLESGVIHAVIGELQIWKRSSESAFTFNKSLNGLEWHILMFNVEVIKLLRVCVSNPMFGLNDEIWDFILCSTVSWVQSLKDTIDLDTDPSIQLLATEINKLVSSVATCINIHLPSQPESFPTSLVTEWKEFFSPNIYTTLLPVFVKFTCLIQSDQMTLGARCFLLSLCEAISHCPAPLDENHVIPAKLEADMDCNLPDHLQSILNHLCPLLISPSRCIQVAAYKLLLGLMPSLPKFDEGKEEEGDKEKEEISRSPPTPIIELLNKCSIILEHVLVDIQLGELTEFDPCSEEHLYAFAYLLSWDLLLVFIRAAPDELKAEYVQFIKEHKLLHTLLRNLFSIMPEAPVLSLNESLSSSPPLQQLSNTKNLFAEKLKLHASGLKSREELQHLACSLYHGTLKQLPAAVRRWWISQDKRTAGLVDRFTTKYVSPILCAEELNGVQEREINSENMTVKIRRNAREVVTIYTVQEFSMELLVTLPINHPLGPVVVDSGKRIGVTNTQWRNWMLQLTTFLTHQNGLIIDGLLLWKRNVDKRFEGLEDCMICFSVIHSSNYQLPKLGCNVCKKRFHAACLYKWFNTSNNTSCPMCRNLFF